MGSGSRTGRRPGDSDTRATILTRARALFADRGYAGTSVRAVAAAAEVDPALVHHYFGTKEELFRESLDVPINPAEIIAAVSAGGPDEMPLRLVQTFLRLWDSPDTGQAMAGFVRRLLAEPENAEPENAAPENAAPMREFLRDTVLRTAAATLLADVEPDEARRRMSLAMSQLFGLMIARHLVGLEPLASWPSGELADVIAPTIARYLHGDLTQSSTPTPPTSSEDAS